MGSDRAPSRLAWLQRLWTPHGLLLLLELVGFAAPGHMAEQRLDRVARQLAGALRNGLPTGKDDARSATGITRKPCRN